MTHRSRGAPTDPPVTWNSGSHFGSPKEGWALRDSNPRPSPCKGGRNPQVSALSRAQTLYVWDL